jgi:hypothetical protein
MLTDAMRAELDSWVNYLSTNGPKLSPDRFQEIAVHIAAVERGDKTEPMDREKFQKDVDDEETAKKAKDADKDPKRMLADEGNNITLEVWPQGFVNLLIGGKPSGSATIGGMVVGGRAFTEEDKFSTREDGTKVPIEPMRVAITAPGILSLISKADEGLEYRRQLELDGVKYAIARDQSRANPDLHMRVMRSISEITTLKKYVEDLRESALEKYRVNPPVNKELSDFLRIPERQTSAPAPGLGNRNINLGKDRATVDDPMNDAGLYKG